VLRPWGLRSSAPLTESPALPEMAAARNARRATGSRKRPLFKVATGVVGIVALSGVIAYPYSSVGDGRALSRGRDIASSALPQVVAIADMTVVKESMPTVVREEPLVMAPATKPVVTRSVETSQRPTPRSPVVEAPPPEVREAPTPEVAVVATIVQPPQETPQPPVDPWHPLREALAGCTRIQGLWDRATCEQRARLASCDGHWGAVALCPAGRTEFGQ